MVEWKKEAPIEGGHGGCLNCGFQHAVLPLNEGGIIAVGFGYAALEMNGEPVFVENDENNPLSFDDAEQLAVDDPDNDWRIHLEAPLSERHYQRQGVGEWVLYKRGTGFA